MPETMMDRLQREMQEHFPPHCDDDCDCVTCRSDLAKILPCEREEG